MDDVTWRRGAADDEPLLFTLFESVKAGEFASLGLTAEQLRPLLEMQFRARQIGYAQTYPAATEMILCLEDGTPAGRYLVERQANCYRCIDIAVLPELRNRGIGTWALRQMQQVAALEQIVFRLSVSKNNPALKLYERLGFFKVSADELAYEMEWQPPALNATQPKAPEKITLSAGVEVDREDVLHRVFDFLHEIGLRVELASVPSTSFLPGIQLVSGGLRVDLDALLYPGDLLHEAGHLAVMTPRQRNEEFPSAQELANEIAAQAWSYAAALHIGITPEIVFHDNGYKGQARALLQAYKEGRQVGVPILSWVGLTSPASAGAPSIYPKMLGWLRADPSSGEGAGEPVVEVALQ
jgi:GNAT superfamily N-acetyltransferase